MHLTAKEKVRIQEFIITSYSSPEMILSVVRRLHIITSKSMSAEETPADYDAFGKKTSLLVKV